MRRNVNVWARIDWFTVILYLILVLMGWINIYAAVYSEEHRSIFDWNMRYGKQLVWIGAAILIALITLSIDTRAFSFFAYAVYAFSLISLLLVLVLGKEVNGARAWFEIGQLRLQPTEFAKVATCLVVAKYLSSYNVRTDKIKTWIIACIFIAIPAMLIALQPDVGSVVVFAAFTLAFYREGFPGIILLFGFLLIFLSLIALIAPPITVLIIILIMAVTALFIVRLRISELILAVTSLTIGYFVVKLIALHLFHRPNNPYFFLLITTGIVGIFPLINSAFKKIPHIPWIIVFTFMAIGFTYSVDYLFDNFLQPHQQQRINILLGKESDPKGAEYNVAQSKIAIGSGGLLGKGFLQGTQTKFNFVPEQSTDFIFCTVGEEWGFIGSTVVLGLFVILLLRILHLSELQRSAFSRIYGYGVASILFMHIAINVGMTLGLLPVIGIPLPFFSYGGSSLWAFTLLLFIFLRLDASRLEVLR
ncbi:MAG TPA: rod shape-determining protein RodA [Bacteroidales bacterium]|nr:rod shape-determining protein RodA [Bacteroidales bacterium]HPO65155.1 rod shape-determining protein RodA [Bacteroidales bacterium]